MMTVAMGNELGKPRADIDEEAHRITEEAERRGLTLRLMGGAAIRMLIGARLHPAFERTPADLDFVVAKQDRRATTDLLAEAGYVADEQFNALNGHRRMLFNDPEPGRDRQVDVFVETFEMCHELPLAERLHAVPHTLAPAELVMTKLQIISLNAKDRGDLYALLLACDTGGDDDSINVERIAELTAGDWGLQHTFELNLERLRAGLEEQSALDAGERSAIAGRIDAIADAMERAPKSRRWKLRAKIGERKRWYEEPEEVDR